MAEVVATAISKEVVGSCFGMIAFYISNTRKYKRNMERLKVELRKIEDTSITVLKEVCTAENNAEDIRQDVLGWLQKCEELKGKVNELFDSARPFHGRCLCCRCPTLKSRYVASSEAVKLASLITQHVEEGKFDKVGQQPRLGQLPLLSPGEFHCFRSRTTIMKEVMDDLENDSIHVIALCGMGGIGKTTLVKTIAEDVKTKKLFDEVAFVVVSQDVNVKGIQDQLASRLGLMAISNEMDVQGRAELVYKRLMDEKKTILVILDDIWQELNLRSVGIPVHGDRKGFKIILTTRYDNVCSDMKVNKRLQVGILPKDEALNLFKMTCEISEYTIPDIAEKVSQECAGLPLAIVTVGKSLRNKTEHAFRDVLRKLRDTSRSNTSRIHGVLYSCIKSSYDYLESDEHRSLLLVCSLFPEDYEIPVEDLVRYARGLFDTFETMTEARDRVEAVVDELIKCHLLLLGEENKCVKLHDVVRDICVSIRSKSSDVHISLKFDELPKTLFGLKSQRLRLLRLISNEAFWKSEFYSGGLWLEETTNKEMNFSEEMHELRVLELNQITTKFPSSLQFMINLETLSLDYCRLQGDLSGIGNLKMLRVLSFFHSIIEMFPTEIAELTNLQCLDLRFHMKYPAIIPFGTLSFLKELEELYLGDNVLGDFESFKEVCSLSKLNSVQLMIEDDRCLEVLLKNLNLSELIRFDIAQIEGGGRPIYYQIGENMLDLWLNNVHVDLYRLEALMCRVEWFNFNGEGLPNVVEFLGENSGFPKLSKMYLVHCDMKYFVDLTKHQKKWVFSKLEVLQIRYSSQLEELIHGDYLFGTVCSRPHEANQVNLNVREPFQCPLGNLRKLEICQCENIKSLFLKSMVKNLRNLDHINERDCPKFERIVKCQKDEDEDFSEVCQFPALRYISLNEVPGFSSLEPKSSLNADFNQALLSKLEDLFISFDDSVKERGVDSEKHEVCFYLGSSLPKLRYLNIHVCNNLLSIAKYGLVHGFQELEKLVVSICKSLEVVFDFESVRDQTILLDRLESLDLDFLPNLKQIWKNMLPKEIHVFRNLKKLQVTCCGNLRYLLKPTVMNILGNLEEIVMVDNKSMEAMIGSDIPDEAPKSSISFPRLQKLTINDVRSFRKLCFCPDFNLELPSLTELQIRKSPVDILARETLALQNLIKIEVEDCGGFKYLFSSSAQVLVHLQELVLGYNHSMESIFGSENSESETIVLPKLRKIEISYLRDFRMICCSLNVNVGLPSLNQLCINECAKMSKLCAGELTAPQLKHVNYGCGKKEVPLQTFINSWLKDCESMTHCLNCTCYGNESCSHFGYQSSESEDDYQSSESGEVTLL